MNEKPDRSLGEAECIHPWTCDDCSYKKLCVKFSEFKENSE